jgi:predicted nucleic acid-binding protein
MVDAGPSGAWAETVLAEGPLFGPELLPAETTNILRRLEQAKRITTLEATSAHEDHKSLHIELYSFLPFADRIWALRHTLTSYDAWYVALAEALNVPLATLDLRLAKAYGPACEFLLPRGV